MELFHNRFHAGQILAESLGSFRGADNLLILGLPRGGVLVAFEVAKALEAPLDVFLVRKLGLPGRRELAMGAIATGGVIVLNHEVVHSFQLSPEEILHVAQIEQRELERQERVFRHGRPPPEVTARTVILVDDGLATGSTMRAAVQSLRQQEPKRLIVAVPVGAADTCEFLRDEADEVVCPIAPDDFTAVGAWYEDFSPIPDPMVTNLLEEASLRDLSNKVLHPGLPDPKIVKAWGD